MQSCNSFIDDMQYAGVELIFYLWLVDVEAVPQDHCQYIVQELFHSHSYIVNPLYVL
jgi:hypothetical protein